MTSYEAYLDWMQMDYSEFVIRMKLIKMSNIIYIGITIFCLIQIIKFARFQLDPETYRKLKKISQWENRSKENQVIHIIKMYIDNFTKLHNINWDEHLY